MKSKIRFRLLAYFIGSILIFSLVISVIFSLLFSRHNTEAQKAVLGKHAVRIAETMSVFFESGMAGREHGMGRGRGMYGHYMNFLDSVSMSDVWIVDRNMEQIQSGHMGMCMSYKDLPPDAEKVVREALGGNQIFSESFGEFMGTPTITVAVPITAENDYIAGAVLLHSKVEDISDVTRGGFLILLSSMAAAVLISFFVANNLAGRFTRPLGKMKDAARKISGGDYAAKTGVAQDDEIGELAATLDDMAGKLEAASLESARMEQLRRDFMANVSHELRTPVTVIRGSLEALRDGIVTKPEMVSEYYGQMLSESRYLEHLVSDLLDLAKLQNPDFTIEMRDVDMKEIADDAARSVKHIAERKNTALRVSAADGESFPASGDYHRLRQMLTIVLDNAVKFSPPGSTVMLDLRSAGGNIILSVRDEGCGIEREALPHVFRRFYKQRSEENKHGTGLGLAIAKQIADRHGITIEITSETGAGTEVRFLQAINRKELK